MLSDRTVVAMKQLSSESRQGYCEFLNEVCVISCLQHSNLVKLHGCCIERDQRMLVYEYLENNSLSNALFGECFSKMIAYGSVYMVVIYGEVALCRFK
ncbi:putative non-specific protein-tyrosine kinase RLK-Pelle-DLSV family [Helianthus annuus]|nr:putative non-specific protein-tyrosine kinase RLK-Pelle-DLSV family [Helianthus annuus]